MLPKADSSSVAPMGIEETTGSSLSVLAQYPKGKALHFENGSRVWCNIYRTFCFQNVPQLPTRVRVVSHSAGVVASLNFTKCEIF